MAVTEVVTVAVTEAAAMVHTVPVMRPADETHDKLLAASVASASSPIDDKSTTSDAVDGPPPEFCHHFVTEPTDVPPNVWRIHGRDYDLTSFVDQHPGGALFILIGKGLDCTHFFEFYHVFSVPRKRLRQYDVTPDGCAPAVPECGSAFMRDVRQMVQEHFGQTSCKGGKHKANCGQWMLMLLVLAAEVYATWQWLACLSVGWGALAAGLNWLLMANMMHDGSHAALSSRPWVNHVGQFVGSIPWACGQAQWWLQHVVSHHPNINQVGLDVDCHHFPWARWHHRVDAEIEPRPGRRVRCREAIAGAHQLLMHTLAYLGATSIMCHFYTFFFVLLPYLGPRVTSSRFAKAVGMRAVWDDGRDEHTPKPRHGLMSHTGHTGQFGRLAGNFGRQGVLMYSRALFIGNVVAWLLAVALVFVPIGLSLRRRWLEVTIEGLDSPPWTDVLAALGAALLHGLVLALVPIAVCSLCFMFVTQVREPPRDSTTISWRAHDPTRAKPLPARAPFGAQISHIQQECQCDDVLNEPDPFKRQAQTSLDYSPSAFSPWRFLTGGLNLQSIHHVLPSVSCVHYPVLYPKFVAICKQHGCMPQQADGFAHAVWKHWMYVYRLGRGDALPWPEGWPGVRSAA